MSFVVLDAAVFVLDLALNPTYMKHKFYFVQELRFYCRNAENLRALECYAVSVGKQLPMS